MKWLEVIELRTVESNRDLLESQLLALLDDIEKAEKKKKVKLFRHATVNTDFCIHLLHESEKIEGFGSELSVHIASALKEQGLVSHYVWIETNKERHKNSCEDI